MATTVLDALRNTELFRDVSPSMLSISNEAAKIRGVTRQAILDLIARDRLPAERVGRQWLILKAEMKNFERMAPGPKPRATKEGVVKSARTKAKKRR